MAYLGGKSKSADHILSVLNNPAFDNLDYIEPFCGYCHILRRVRNKNSYTATDNNQLLIRLLKHNRETKGQHPDITQVEYHSLKLNPDQDTLRAAYAGFCYSFNGKFFGGFVNLYKNRDYPAERKRYYDQLHDNETFSKTQFHSGDYGMFSTASGVLIYCDPPYANTTEYHSKFDSAKFWEDVRILSKNNIVLVSEYQAPEDFVCLVQKEKSISVSGQGATRKRMEKLFIHGSLIDDPKIKAVI